MGGAIVYICNRLMDLTVSGGLTIVNDVVSQCDNLKTITISSGAKTIANGAFAACPRLTTVNLPTSIIRIEAGAFANSYSETLNLDRAVNYAGTVANWNSINVGTDLFIDHAKIVCTDGVIYRITFAPGDGSGTMAPTTAVSIGVDSPASYTLPDCEFTTPDITKTFAGWDVNGTTYQPGPKCSISENTTITATWKDADPAFTVTFDADGGTGTMDPVILNEAEAKVYELPVCEFTAPTGKLFQGWQVGDDTTVRAPGYICAIEADTPIKAIWEDAVTVTFNPGTGTGTMASKTMNMAAAANYTLPACGFTAPANSTFSGWKVGTDETLLQPGAACKITANTTITAVWESAHTVSFAAGGGTGTMQSQALSAACKTFTLPQCGFTPPHNKLFAGWDLGGTTYQPGDPCEITQDTEFTAVWKDEPIAYTVTFAPGGGAGTMAPVPLTATDGKTYTLPECTFTAPTGKVFAGWTVNGTDYESGAACPITADTTVTARWEVPAVTVTVAFDANGGTTPTPSKQVTTRQPYGPLPTPTRSGFIFAGWFTAADGGARIREDTVSDLTQDASLYAHWDIDYLKKLTYKFSNSAYAFRYPEGYHIPYKRYQMIYGDTALAKSNYEWDGPWGGSCGGFATSTALFLVPGNDIDVSDFKNGPSYSHSNVSEFTTDAWSSQ